MKSVLLLLSMLMFLCVSAFGEGAPTEISVKYLGEVACVGRIENVFSAEPFILVKQIVNNEFKYSVYNSITRKLLWSHKLENQDEYVSSVCTSSKAVIFLLANVDKMEYRLEARAISSGDLMWSHLSKPKVYVGKSVVIQDVLFLRAKHCLERYNVVSGESLSDVPFPSGMATQYVYLIAASIKYLAFAGGFVVENGNMYRHEYDLWIYNIKASKWKRPDESLQTCIASTMGPSSSFIHARISGDHLVSSTFMPNKLYNLEKDSSRNVTALNFCQPKTFTVIGDYFFYFRGYSSNLIMVDMKNDKATAYKDARYLPLTRILVAKLTDGILTVVSIPSMKEVKSFEFETPGLTGIVYSGSIIVSAVVRERKYFIRFHKWISDEKLFGLRSFLAERENGNYCQVFD